jgi:hypothetical protein
MKLIRISAFIILLYSLATFAQSIDRADIEAYLESDDDTDITYEYMLGQIEFFANNPIDISQATINQIAELPAITYFEAYHIYEYIRINSNANNKNITMATIATHLNLNPLQLYILNHCATIGTPIKHFNAKIRERSSYQIETPVGYENNKYVGEQWNLLQNYTANYKLDFAKISAGTTINKNAGEKHIDEYTSGYLMFVHENVSLIVGDFSIYTGMGNVFGNSYSAFKGYNAIAPAANYTNKIAPYTSKLDYNLMRGAATRLDIPIFEKNHLASTIWYSHAPRSATITKDGYVSSLFTTGYYRTTTDVAKKNSITENNVGATIELSGCDYSIGALLNYLDYGKEIRSSSGRAFSGQMGYLSSFYGSAYFDNVNLSAELSLDNHSNIGFKFGTAYKSKPVDFAIHFRSFDENFRAPYGTIFGEYSYPSNEIGLYTGLVWRPTNYIRLTSFVDCFYSYESTYTVDTNVSGFQIFSQLDYKFNSANSIYARINYKNKTDEVQINKTPHFYQKDKLNLRLEYEHSFAKYLSLKLRADAIYIGNKGMTADETGFALFAECNYAITNWLKLQLRTTYFTTDTYTSAIYQFDYFYPGYSYSAALYNEGTRSFIALQFSPADWCKLYIRYINMYKPEATTLGSGNELINSNMQNRIYSQLEIKF